MRTSERHLRQPHTWTFASALAGRRAPSEPQDAEQAKFPTNTAIRRLLITVAGISVITFMLALEAWRPQLNGHLAVESITALILIPVLWACSAGVYLARRRSVAAYSQIRQRLSAFIGTANEVLWEITTDGVITYVAPRTQTFLGYAPGELHGQRIDDLLAVHERQRARDLLATSLAGRHGWTGEQFTMLTPEGHQKAIYASAHIHLAPNGRALGFTGTLREVEPEARPEQDNEPLKASVHAVLSRRKLHTLYQPIVSLDRGVVIGAEALTRFTAEPALTPDVWFRRAGEVGLGIDLELLALSAALESAHKLPDHIYLSINMSPDALADHRTASLLEHGAWPCSQLIVEITEHVSVADYACLAEAVTVLRRLGVRIAVDDAGAGYASFRHILHLRPDYIKLDRALVDGLDHDTGKRALAGAFVAFGEELEAPIIAEGVETAAELSAARALGMYAAQGFHTGRPAPAGDTWGSD